MSELLGWLLVADLGSQQLALLVTCCAALYVLTAITTWRLRRWATAWLVRSWPGKMAGVAARLVYYVGVPAVILWRGSLVREIGIPTTYAWRGGADTPLSGVGLLLIGSDAAWLQALAFGSLTMCVLLAVWTWYVRNAIVHVREVDIIALARPSVWASLLQAVSLQITWAFYRAVVMQWSDDLAVCAFASLALTVCCWILDPWRRSWVRQPGQAYVVARDWLLALFTAVLSLSVRTLPLLIALHFVWVLASDRVVSHLAYTQVEAAYT